MRRSMKYILTTAAIGTALSLIPWHAFAVRSETSYTITSSAEATVASFQQRGAVFRKLSAICSATVAGKWNFYHLRTDGTTEVLAEELPNDVTGADAAANDVIEWVPQGARPFVRAKFDPTAATSGTAFCEFIYYE